MAPLTSTRRQRLCLGVILHKNFTASVKSIRLCPNKVDLGLKWRLFPIVAVGLMTETAMIGRTITPHSTPTIN